MEQERAAKLVRSFVNLADATLGAQAVAASDEFFAAKERILNPAPPLYTENRFDDHGQWMDGWETRRRRSPGFDYCIVRLAYPGRITTIDIDGSIRVSQRKYARNS